MWGPRAANRPNWCTASQRMRGQSLPAPSVSRSPGHRPISKDRDDGKAEPGGDGFFGDYSRGDRRGIAPGCAKSCAGHLCEMGRSPVPLDRRPSRAAVVDRVAATTNPLRRSIVGSRPLEDSSCAATLPWPRDNRLGPLRPRSDRSQPRTSGSGVKILYSMVSSPLRLRRRVPEVSNIEQDIQERHGRALTSRRLWGLVHAARYIADSLRCPPAVMGRRAWP
jgi:hypothetical protein